MHPGYKEIIRLKESGEVALLQKKKLKDYGTAEFFMRYRSSSYYVVIGHQVNEFFDHIEAFNFYYKTDVTPPGAVYHTAEINTNDIYEDYCYQYTTGVAKTTATYKVLYNDLLPNGKEYAIYTQCISKGTWCERRYFIEIGSIVCRFWNLDTMLKFEKDLRSGLLLKMRPELNGKEAPEYNFNRYTNHHKRYIKDSSLIGHCDMPNGVTADLFKSTKYNTWYLRYLDFIYTFKSLHACQAVCELLKEAQDFTAVTLSKGEDLVRLEKIRKRLEAYMNATALSEYSTIPLEVLLTELSD